MLKQTYGHGLHVKHKLYHEKIKNDVHNKKIEYLNTEKQIEKSNLKYMKIAEVKGRYEKDLELKS